MALGNWATLAVRLDGAIIDTVKVNWPTSVSGVLIEIYKNWVYVSDEAAPKRPNDSYTRPLIMQIQHGSLTYVDWSVLACRGPQEGIYLAAWSSDHSNKSGPYPMVGFVGCGVYGYDHDAWIGVLPSSVEFLRSWLASVSDDLPEEVSNVVIQNNTSVDQGSAFFARNVPKLIEDPNFDVEKAR